jgi:hypothetical protein
MTESQEERRSKQEMMQAVINDLVAQVPGGSVTELSARLREALAAIGIPPQPENWIEAVAHDAVSGRVYVISDEAAEDTALDLPERDEQEASRPSSERPGTISGVHPQTGAPWPLP